MKSDRLVDAIGQIDADLVARADAPVRRRGRSLRHLKWTAPVAASLVLALCVGLFFGQGGSMLAPGLSSGNGDSLFSPGWENPFMIRAKALAVAEYPPMSPYPEGEGLPGFDDRYEAWKTDRDRQLAYRGAGKGLERFFSSTVSTFLADAGEENVVYSPLNVYMALAMLAEMSDGNSRRQVLDLLGADSLETLHTQATAVWNANYSNDGAVTSIMAGSLWLNEDVKFNQATLDTLAQRYYASSYQGKMGDEKFNNALRSWLNKQTGGLLSDHVAGVETLPDTVLTLATTLYFRAKWESEFSEEKTVEDTFHGAAGDVTGAFMKRTDLWGTYYWGERFSAAGLRLENSGHMWFLLPDEGVSPEDLLTDSQAMAFALSNGEWDNQKSLRVNYAVPKFDVNGKLDLKSGLQTLGVTDCFSEAAADFSPLLAEPEPVFLDRVQHSARVAIDEEGVTAAAYTEMVLCGSAMPPEDEVDFVLDRPFLFVLTGLDGLPLFVGVVNQLA